MAAVENQTRALRPLGFADVLVWGMKIVVAMGAGLVLANAVVTWYMHT